jgi:hypothetical protein
MATVASGVSATYGVGPDLCSVPPALGCRSAPVRECPHGRPSRATDWGRVAGRPPRPASRAPLSCPRATAAATPEPRRRRLPRFASLSGAPMTSPHPGTWSGFPGVPPLYRPLPSPLCSLAAPLASARGPGCRSRPPSRSSGKAAAGRRGLLQVADKVASRCALGHYAALPVSTFPSPPF